MSTMPDVMELTAYDRYVLRNVIVHELRQRQRDLDLFIRNTLTDRNDRTNIRPDIAPLFFKCWIDLALRVCNVPNRSETSEHMLWDPEYKLNYDQAELNDDEDILEAEEEEEREPEEQENAEDFKSKLIFRNKRFYRLWFHDKVGRMSHLPLVIPVDDTISYYLAFYILHLRPKHGYYLYNGLTPWDTVAKDIKQFITKCLGLGNIIHERLLHNMRHFVADTIGVVTNFNMSIMNDVSLVMRHSHQMQQTHYATGTKWGQISTSLHDHQSYQRDNVKLIYPENRLQSWQEMSQAIKDGKFRWGTTVVNQRLPVATLRRSPLLDDYPLFQHFREYPPKFKSSLQESFQSCLPHNKDMVINPNEFLDLHTLKRLLRFKKK
jgi:hypothetical protein